MAPMHRWSWQAAERRSHARAIKAGDQLGSQFGPGILAEAEGIGQQGRGKLVIPRCYA
jgi:hypothetical protein